MGYTLVRVYEYEGQSKHGDSYAYRYRGLIELDDILVDEVVGGGYPT